MKKPSTPERSVVEIVEEFANLPVKGLAETLTWLEQTLQAERQNREELVERVLSNIRLSYLDKGAKTAIEFALEEALTQPNNPK